MAVTFKGAHFPQEIILTGVRWYVAYPLSYRHVEELMQERGVAVDYTTIQLWVVKYSPQLEAAFHRRKQAVWLSWRMDETYIKVKGAWKYLGAVAKTIGNLLQEASGARLPITGDLSWISSRSANGVTVLVGSLYAERGSISAML